MKKIVGFIAESAFSERENENFPSLSQIFTVVAEFIRKLE